MANNRTEVVRVRLRYPDLDTFVEKFAPNVTRGGIFLASRDPRPVGEVLRFEVLLRQGGPVLSGQGRVTWVKEFNPTEPHRPYGMGVQFLQVDPQARSTLDKLLQRKQARTMSGIRPTDQGGGPFRPTVEQAVLAGEGNPDQMDDGTLRRTLDRARVLSARTDDLEALLAPEPEEERATLSQALSDLPRLLAGRRATGAVRLLPEDPGRKNEAS